MPELPDVVVYLERLRERFQGQVLRELRITNPFVVRSVDASRERVHIDAEVVASGALREFFGFNRGKNAVVEAAILATRFHILPADEVVAEYRKLRVIVDKTGGPAEREAMAFLEGEFARFREGGGRR